MTQPDTFNPATRVYRNESGKIDYQLVEQNRPPTFEETYGCNFAEMKKTKID